MSTPTVRDRILSYIHEHGASTAKDLEKSLSGTSYGYIRSQLVALAREGHLSRTERGIYAAPDSGPLVATDSDVRYNPAGTEYDETVQLLVYLHIRASAGPGEDGWEPADDSDAVRLQQSKRFFAELLGFWPSDNLRGLRVEGESGNGGRSPIASGQIILFEPAISIEGTGRYVLAAVSPSEPPRIIVKRVQPFVGGGVRLASDNPEFPDEILVPTEDGDGLRHQLTGQRVEVGVVGRVVWPRDGVDASTAAYVTATIERMLEAKPQ